MLLIKNISRCAIGLMVSFLAFVKCGEMNNNPIYKYNAVDLFRSPQLEVAQAIRAKRADLIPEIIQKNDRLDLNKKYRPEMTLLVWAIAHQYPTAVKSLLDLGADPNIPTGEGESTTYPIALCAGGENDQNFNLLLEYGANPNGEIEGTPAVFKTIYVRRFDRLKKLLNHGANINAIDNQTSKSLVHFCSMLQLYDIVLFLLENGADYRIKDPVGGSVALEIQEMKGKLNATNEENRQKVEDKLIQMGVKFPVAQPWESN